MLSQAEIAALTEFLLDPTRPDDTLCFQELQGFLYAVACSPELVPPSAWLPAISDDEDIGFEDEAEAQRIMGLIIELYNGINDLVFVRSECLFAQTFRGHRRFRYPGNVRCYPGLCAPAATALLECFSCDG